MILFETSTGEQILGIGDWGVGGIEVSIGKLAIYTAAGGIDPTRVIPVMLDVGSIWLTQVALILFGHIVSVYLAHVEALRIFATPRRAAVSQLPMLLLMVVFTSLGLWILSLPIAAG